MRWDNHHSEGNKGSVDLKYTEQDSAHSETRLVSSNMQAVCGECWILKSNGKPLNVIRLEGDMIQHVFIEIKCLQVLCCSAH